MPIRRRVSVKKDGKAVNFNYNAATQAWSVTIDGQKHSGHSATLAQARTAVRALLRSG